MPRLDNYFILHPHNLEFTTRGFTSRLSKARLFLYYIIIIIIIIIIGIISIISVVIPKNITTSAWKVARKPLKAAF